MSQELPCATSTATALACVSRLTATFAPAAASTNVVVSADSNSCGRIFSLPYTAVESSPDVLGRLAVEQLVRRIGDPGQAGPTVVRLVAPELVNRGSTA